MEFEIYEFTLTGKPELFLIASIKYQDFEKNEMCKCLKIISIRT